MLELLRLAPALLLAVLAWRLHRAIRRFQEAGATSPESARPLGELGLAPRTIARLERRGVVREAAGQRYYLDPDGHARWTRRKRRILAVVLPLLVVVAVVVALTSE